ncbi:MAG: hypothetical protein J5852_08310, partial [Clostridia bacterium]|nr:hypothetical protein [Clostridia bacterium]
MPYIKKNSINAITAKAKNKPIPIAKKPECDFATITVTTKDGSKKATCAITVKEAVSLSFKSKEVKIEMGQALNMADQLTVK